MASVKRRRRTQQERTAESTQRLIAAAIGLIAEKGFAATSAAEISERAGYSRSMVQFRWGTKEALLESLLRDEYETRLLPPGSGEDATGLERVLHQIAHLDDETAANPELMRGFFALCFESIGPVRSLNTWITDWLARYEEETKKAIRAGQEDDSIRPELDPGHRGCGVRRRRPRVLLRWMVAPERVGYADYMRAWREQVAAHLGR